jgi:hypothetical protein
VGQFLRGLPDFKTAGDGPGLIGLGRFLESVAAEAGA